MANLRYLVALLAFGAMADWASEMMFWSAPPAWFAPGDHLITVLAYGAAAGLAIAVIASSGFGGIGAAFLGGALVGLTVEGVVVSTIYDNFPWQLVWTPIAWHALVSGALVIGMGRAVGRIGPARMAACWLALGLVMGVWAQGWPLEQDGPMPDLAPTLAYLAGLGLVVPVANVVLDRFGTLPRPGRWVGLILPAVALAVWTMVMVADPSPVRLAGPLLIALTAWMCWRLGAPGDGQGRAPVSLGLPAARGWHHFLFLIAPITMAGVAVAGWSILGGIKAHLPLAVLTSTVGLGWYLLLLGRAVRGRAVRRA